MKVMVFGTFDGLHEGHRFVLNEAQKRGDVTVIIARDHNVQNIKGRTPMRTEDERMRDVQMAFPEMTILLGDADDFLAPVRLAKPELIVLGYDQMLPPGVTEEDLLYPIERLPAFESHRYKSSLLRDPENI